MKPSRTVNMNARVKVKLTTQGFEILQNEYRKLGDILPCYKDWVPKLDEGGYYHCQLWNLFEYFGPHIRIGFCVPFDTEIIICEE